jgi:hypothetical protein
VNNPSYGWSVPAIPAALVELADAERELQRLLTELSIRERADKTIITSALRVVLNRVTLARSRLTELVDANLERRGCGAEHD